MEKLAELDIKTVTRNEVYMLYINGHITKLQYNDYIREQLLHLIDR